MRFSLHIHALIDFMMFPTKILPKGIIGLNKMKISWLFLNILKYNMKGGRKILRTKKRTKQNSDVCDIFWLQLETRCAWERERERERAREKERGGEREPREEGAHMNPTLERVTLSIRVRPQAQDQDDSALVQWWVSEFVVHKRKPPSIYSSTQVLLFYNWK